MQKAKPPCETEQAYHTNHARQESACHDVVLLVGPNRHTLAIKALRSIQVFSQMRKIIIVTHARNFSLFTDTGLAGRSIVLRDEDTIVEGLNLSFVRQYLVRRGASPERAGWYFQQFLKMGISLMEDTAEHYLIWDSDTIMLHPIPFFDERDRSKVLIKPSTEYHKPYFESMHRLLGMERGVDFSFISEHMMVRKEYMAELITAISQKDKHQPWFVNILDSIDTSSLNLSGFSEFETYGNFIQNRHPESFRIRTLNSLRKGAKSFGLNPSRFNLYDLSKRYDYVTFETVHYQSMAKVMFRKVRSLVTYLYDRSIRDTGECDERLVPIRDICLGDHQLLV